MSVPRVLLAAVAASLAAAPLAAAAPVVNGEFPLPQAPNRIAPGPDGNMWVTMQSATDDVARITPDGTVTAFNVANVAFPIGITTGPDGNLWITQAGGVARFSPADPAGTGQAFPIAGLAANGIVAGPDGNLWTASDDKVLKIPPGDPATLQTFTVAGMGAREIASGSDGRIWVVDFSGKRIVGMTTDGTPTFHDVGGGPQDVAAGANGQVAFTNPGATTHVVGRLVNGGTPALTELPQSDPFGITYASDAAYWTAQFPKDTVTRITADGQATTLTGLTAGSGPRRIAAGPGNTVWVTLETTGKVARITGLEPPPPPAPADTTAPVLTGLSLTPATFRSGRPVTAAGRRARPGTLIRFRLSEAATVTLRFERAVPGRRSAGRCVAPRPSLSRAARCTRFVPFGTVRRAGTSGANRVAFTGRIGSRRLPAGAWRLAVTARDAAGNPSATVRRPFRVVR